MDVYSSEEEGTRGWGLPPPYLPSPGLWPAITEAHSRAQTPTLGAIIGQVAGVGVTGMARLLAQAMEGLSSDPLCWVGTFPVPCRTKGSHRNCGRGSRCGLWLS